ncbi:MAG: integration host factor subunit alpha [Candidatus Pelagibacter bacterium]|jgi:integration host factor subunit alpha|nr:integration host factor subunit alpha [Candidatus Pelagibacter sp.]MDP7541265.1 integration host factor subunit alpha [Candidatus Pelagibacter bacterium]|tara:strand:+ start:520 stop:819 length:300 start_codon:yes stop_codon:yes gene_type:complete
MRINLTKKNIVNALYMQIGYSKKISVYLLEDIFQLILDNLTKHNKVKIAKFGTFILRKKSKRIGRNPKTKENKIISERKVILFRPSKELKKSVNFRNDH